MNATKEEANRLLIAQVLKRYQDLQQTNSAAAAAAAAADGDDDSKMAPSRTAAAATTTAATIHAERTTISSAFPATSNNSNDNVMDIDQGEAAAAAANKEEYSSEESQRYESESAAAAAVAAAAATASEQPDDEKKKNASLQKEEEEEVVAVAVATHNELLSQMNLLIAAMPAVETNEYYTALLCVPHLVQVESDPIQFLKCMDWNPQLAAQRLVFYWKTRCTLFGQRAFYPMISPPIIISSSSSSSATEINSNFDDDVVEDGQQQQQQQTALTKREWENIRSAHLVLLPKDREGRTVLWAENSRRLDQDGDVVKRCMFYFAQIISENPVSQTEGFVGISLLNDDEDHQKYDVHMTQSVSCITKSFPIKFKAWHIIDLSPNGAFSEWENTFAEFSKTLPCTVHRYERKRDSVSALAAFGLTRQGLPRSIGGLWRYEQFVHWLNERIRLERRRFPTLPCPSGGGGGVVFGWNKSTLINNDVAADHEEQEDDGENNNNNNIEPTDILQNYRRLLEEAMNQIPVPQKQAYMEALQMASNEIWENESNRDWFLSVEDLNCWFAAKRIARYWQVRSEAFRERRYLPLHQTGDGALNRADLSVLGTAFLKILPNDTDGCPVIWMNPPKLEGVFNSEAYVKRCMFYMFSLLAENEESQKNGATLLYMCGGKDDDLTSAPSNLLSYVDRLVNALPIHFKTAHLLRLSNEPIPDRFIAQFHFSDEVFTHVSMNKAELVANLQSHGIEPLKLPKRLGGEWTRAKYFEWQELRTRCEWHLPLGLSGRSVIVQGSNEFPALRPYSVLSDDEKAERKRRLDVIHSRRKRDRIRIETEVLVECVEELEDEREALKAETSRLESLLEAARGMTTEQTT